MHDEFYPADAPDPDDPDVHFGAAPKQITTELYQLCEEFLRRASPTVHMELNRFLTEKGYGLGSLGWFLDALGSTFLLEPHRQLHRKQSRCRITVSDELIYLVPNSHQLLRFDV